MRSKGGKDLFNARAILGRLFHLSFSTRAAALVASRPSELFNECPTLFGAEAECLVNRALPNEEEAILCKARTIKELVEIAEPDALSVQQVLLASTAICAACNLNLCKGKVKEPIVVGDAERHLGESELATLLRSGKDHLIDALGTNPTPRFTECPAQCIHDIRLATAVWPHDGGDPWSKCDRGLIREGFEAAEPNLAQAQSAHRTASFVTPRRSIAASAAAASAALRLGPLPRAISLPSIRTAHS